MKQAICSAKIHECAEIGNILNSSLNYIAGLDGGEKLLLHLFALSHKQNLAVADVSASVGVVLSDHELDLLTEILVQILLISIGYQACRDEYSYFINYYTESAGKDLCHLSCENFLIVVSFFDALVAAVSCQSLVGKKDLAVAVIDLDNLDFKLVANMKHFCEIHR